MLDPDGLPPESLPLPSLLLQRFIIDRSPDTRGLYWQAFPVEPGTVGRQVEVSGSTLEVPPNTRLNFDTYFNAFFESLWRRHTRLGTLVLQLRVEGPCTIRVLRRAPTGFRLLHEQVLDGSSSSGDGAISIKLPGNTMTFRQYGLLALELVTKDEPVTFIEANWLAEDPDAATVGLSAVFCTFNREADISRVLGSLAADPAATASLSRIFVVNQGRPGLGASHPVAAAAAQLGSRLRIVEQGNFGGAGGFGRGLLEALDDPHSTHAVLLDDDITLEPDSLLRMAAFFALARAPLLVGGHMLDRVHPTALYEAGGVISDRHWAFQPQHHARDLLDSRVLESLSHPHAVHYNGWWCCGIPLSLVREHGMPMPFFIRGDDAEFGLRLHQAGIPTVAVPGIAVWHEPFYLKNGSWHMYYEIRNLLVTASLHTPIARWEVVRRMGRHLAMMLLTFRYYNAALILSGIRDYLAGPAILRAQPQPLHAALAKLRERYPPVFTDRGTVLEPQRLVRNPRSTLGYLLTLARLVVSNAVAPTRSLPAKLLQMRDLHWPCMRGVEHVAVETWWDEALPTFHRSREDFRRLATEAVRLLWALFRQAPAQAQRWQAAQQELTDVAFWHGYLGLKDSAPPLTAGVTENVLSFDPVTQASS